MNKPYRFPSSYLISFLLNLTHVTSDQALAALTPYQTEHINRFGSYTVNFSRTPEPLPPALCKSAGSENKGRPLSISSTYNSLTLCEDFVRIVLVGRQG
jgi:hypothetical protein